MSNIILPTMPVGQDPLWTAGYTQCLTDVVAVNSPPPVTNDAPPPVVQPDPTPVVAPPVAVPPIVIPPVVVPPVVIPPTPVTPPIIVVGTTAYDLTADFNALKPGTAKAPTFYHPPQNATLCTYTGRFFAPAYVTIDGTGCSFRGVGTGGTTPTTSTIFRAINPGFVFQKWADIYATGCLIEVDGTDAQVKYNTCSHVDRFAQINNAATRFLGFHNKVNAGGVGFYNTADSCIIANNTITTLAEYAIRCGPKEDATGKMLKRANGDIDRAVGVIIAGNIMADLPTVASKQNIGIRWGDQVSIAPATIVVDGQSVDCPGNILCEMCAGESATDLPAGYHGSCGSKLRIAGNTFLTVNPNNCPISVQLGMSTAADPFIVDSNIFQDAICASNVGPIGSSSPFVVSNSIQWLAAGYTEIGGKLNIKHIIADSVKLLGKDGGGNKVISIPATVLAQRNAAKSLTSVVAGLA